VEVDVAIIGGGIAGMSLAAELVNGAEPGGRPAVAVLEQESQLAYHASGRSAAAFLESYGSPEIRALTRASRPLFQAASADPDTPALLTPRLLLWVAPEEQIPELEALLAAEPVLRRLDEASTRELCPALRPGYLVASALEEDAQDLDVAGLFEHCRRRARRGGAQIVTGARVRAGSGGESGWRLQTDAGEVVAARVVNAAGAWADVTAELLGVAPVGLTPFRRTVAVASSDAVDRGWPLVGDVAETFYCRPEGSGLLLSPADETPSAPCDARAEVEDVALALERVNEATTLDLRHVRATWAGLRTFAPDRNPVIGFDPARPGFFWLAGQGGYGMQTAPAMAVLAAALLRGEAPPSELGSLDLARVSPARLDGSG
jgi:D-arginine dehydrogenase